MSFKWFRSSGYVVQGRNMCIITYLMTSVWIIKKTNLVSQTREQRLIELRILTQNLKGNWITCSNVTNTYKYVYLRLVSFAFIHCWPCGMLWQLGQTYLWNGMAALVPNIDLSCVFVNGTCKAIIYIKVCRQGSGNKNWKENNTTVLAKWEQLDLKPNH